MSRLDTKLKTLGVKRKVIEDQEAELKRERAKLEDEQIKLMESLDLKVVKIDLGKAKTMQVEVKSKDIPTVIDKVKFHAYIYKNKAIDMLQARISAPAIQARWDEKKVIPGIGKFIKKTVTVKVV